MLKFNSMKEAEAYSKEKQITLVTAELETGGIVAVELNKQTNEGDVNAAK